MSTSAAKTYTKPLILASTTQLVLPSDAAARKRRCTPWRSSIARVNDDGEVAPLEMIATAAAVADVADSTAALEGGKIAPARLPVE